MEDISSTSEEEYSSRSSSKSDSKENPKFETNIDLSSDWDEVSYSPKDNTTCFQPAATSSLLEETKKPPSDPLFDSGYLKSPSPLEATLKLPQENLEVAEVDKFEDSLSTPQMSSDDNRLHLKKTAAKEKFLGPLMSENQKIKLDPNRVNELDRFKQWSPTKTFTNNHLRPQNEFKKGVLRDVAGPSKDWKKAKKTKDKKPPEKTENAEPSPLDDAKSITNCIVLNSLNRVDVGDEILSHPLIRDLSPPPQDINEPIVIVEEHQPLDAVLIPEEGVPEILAPLPVVENGDLANNNRDNEGNNFVAANNEQDQEIDEGIDLLNDNFEELMPLLEDNINPIDNNNDLNIEDVAEANEPVAEIPEVVADHNDAASSEVDISVARASREALYDVNSEQDLLEDFDIPPQANQDHFYEMLSLENVIFLGVNPIGSNDQSASSGAIEAPTNSFPNWLLQILGSQVIPEENQGVLIDPNDQPHFYCQGDGLGVHPSVIALEIDEADEADNDTTTEESSSNNTGDFAEVDPGPSEMFDMSSLPEESSLAEDSQATRATESSILWCEKPAIENVATCSHDVEASACLNITDQIQQSRELIDDIIRTAEETVDRMTQNSSINRAADLGSVCTDADSKEPSNSVTEESEVNSLMSALQNISSSGSDESEYFETRNESF